MGTRQAGQPFASRMSTWETAAALAWLPVHILLLPRLVIRLAGAQLSDAEINLVCYLTGVLYMLLLEGRFLRRDFDPLCERPGRILMEIVLCYGLMLAFNMVVNSLVLLILPKDNPNNSAVMDMALENEGTVTALAVFLAPILEELMFRGGIFGLMRRYNRPLAYLASMLCFALYHVWGYARSDPMNWLYLVQYLPAAWLLCRCYERTDSIWGSIFLHMLINAVSLKALTMLEQLM